MCFLQMDITEEYLKDFDKADPTHMLHVFSTPWFDLSQRSGRKQIAKNLCGIIRRAIDEQGVGIHSG